MEWTPVEWQGLGGIENTQSAVRKLLGCWKDKNNTRNTDDPTKGEVARGFVSITCSPLFSRRFKHQKYFPCELLSA